MLADIKEVKVGGLYKLENREKTRYFKVTYAGKSIQKPRSKGNFSGALIIWYKLENG